MADFDITISESLRLFGVAPADKWNEYNWNAFLWGEGTNKIVTESEVPIADSLVLTGAVATEAEIMFAELLALSCGPTSEVLLDGNGYYYVFTDGATNGEDRDPVAWSSASAGSGSWTSQAVSTTSWSEA
jgi:hypothetical protein